MKTFTPRTVGDWQRWLGEHHDSEAEVWVVFYKRHTGRATIKHTDAIDEALCYGWIDSLVKRLDDSRYALRFKPRKASSPWSAVNRKRYEELKASGRVKEPGLQRPPTDRTYAPKPQLPRTIPQYIGSALKKRSIVWQRFQELAPHERRRYVFWIDFAKREDTKMRRLAEVVRCLAANKPLGLK